MEDAGWRDEKTNSGDGILERWSWNADFHGVGGTVRWFVVVDMVERRERRRGRSGLLRGAMVEEGKQFSDYNLIKGESDLRAQ